MASFPNVIQPAFDDAFRDQSPLKGSWKGTVFPNGNPVVLELGCGKGEYAIGLARTFPGKNFIGTDIKGARMWVGAKTALAEDLANVRFLRTRIEFIQSFFDAGEVDEIWITFPDPQPKVKRTKKRLISSLFLNEYSRFLIPGGKVHLKTDCRFLYEYTLELLKINEIKPEISTFDLYHDKPAGCEPGLLQIQTFYEKLFLSKGMPVTYIRFSLPGGKKIKETNEDTVKILLERYEVQKARFF